MERNTVALTVQENLCCGCGICKAVCPTGCITWGRKNGLYTPLINEERCVGCGRCASVCPGLGHSYTPRDSAVDTVTGTVLECHNAWAKDSGLRYISASGGVVSVLVQKLLESGAYDGAFCLDTYDYRQQLKTVLFTAKDMEGGRYQENAPKSRYLPVSHENAITYMREHREARLILIGSSCALRGLLAAMEALRLKRGQYLLIGLFCDTVFNYNVLRYFEDRFADGKPLAALHFKNKESGGWPGDMKLFPQNGASFYVPLPERAKAKAYFMPERCLYCVDKLNVCADISLGDNYTQKDASAEGSNSVILRTEAGLKAWSMAREELEVRAVDVEDIQTAQAVEWRLNHLYYGDLRMTGSAIDLNRGIPREKTGSFLRAWKACQKRLRSGAVYDTDPDRVKKQMQRDSKKVGPIGRLMNRVIGHITRKIHGKQIR